MKTKTKRIFSMALSLTLCASTLFAAGCKEDETAENGAIPDTNIVLAQGGETQYKIVLPEEYALVLMTGANEIATYIQLSTGATMPVVTDAQVTGGTEEYYISVGETKMLQEEGITATRAELTTDGYKIIRKDNTVFILGASDRATAFGCFEFLEQEIGYEVYTATEVDYQTYDTLYLKDFNLTDIPVIESRKMDGLAQNDQETSFRLRLGLMFGGGLDKFGGSRSVDYIPDADHNTNTVIAVSKNPDYAKFHGGGATQICFSQGEELENAYVTELIKSIQENPKGIYVNLSQEDGKNFCQCDLCKDEARLYGYSGHWIRFLNKLIEKIEAWREENCPDRYWEYTSYFYGDTLAPPVDVQADGSFKIKDDSCYPHEKLNVRITGNCCPLHALDDPDCPSNTKRYLQYQGWMSITDNFHIWDYAANYQCYLPFYNDINKISQTRRLYKEMGVTDLFTEFNSGGTSTQFGYLRLYLYGKTMWNPDEDVEQLINNFFTHYYKDASQEMLDLFNLFRTHDAVLGTHEARASLDRFPRRIIEQAEAYLNKADKKVAAMSDLTQKEKVQTRIEEERMCVNFLKLYFYDSYAYDADDYGTLYSAFEKQLEQFNTPRYSEHTSMTSWMETMKR